MKGTVVLLLLMLTVASVCSAADNATVQEQKMRNATAETEGEAGNATITEIVEPFPSKEAQVAYAVGMGLAQRFSGVIVSISPDHYIEAISKVLTNSPTKLSREEADTYHSLLNEKIGDKTAEERFRIKDKDEIAMVIISEASELPEGMLDALYLPITGDEDPLLVMNAKNYSFTPRKFFESIEWGMQGAIQSASWKELDENLWEVTINTFYQGEMYEEKMELLYKPDANQTVMKEYLSLDGYKPEEGIVESYSKVFELYKKQ